MPRRWNSGSANMPAFCSPMPMIGAACAGAAEAAARAARTRSRVRLMTRERAARVGVAAGCSPPPRGGAPRREPVREHDVVLRLVREDVARRDGPEVVERQVDRGELDEPRRARVVDA